jgi:hypothetical protein
MKLELDRKGWHIGEAFMKNKNLGEGKGKENLHNDVVLVS